ncbi:MarR family transcriptional regulator [Leucobacter sp. Ag1]|nr:MarR family transcriptional regulator [Leucobacter sp. Ag1]
MLQLLAVEENSAGVGGQMDHLALELTRAASRFTRLAGRVPGSTYSTVAWRVLAELELQGPARVSELAQRERIAQPSMTALVQRLESEGWVDRRPDPDDGRATRIEITAAGSAALADYRRAASERFRPLLADLTDFDRATLARASELLQQLADGVDRV